MGTGSTDQCRLLCWAQARGDRQQATPSSTSMAATIRRAAPEGVTAVALRAPAEPSAGGEEGIPGRREGCWHTGHLASDPGPHTHLEPFERYRRLVKERLFPEPPSA
jgi:hypothetical protein